jgi:hypothetical protein
MACFRRQMVSQVKQRAAQDLWRSIVFRDAARAAPKQRGAIAARAAARDVGEQSVTHTNTEDAGRQSSGVEPLGSSGSQGSTTGAAQRGRRRAKFQIVQSGEKEQAEMTDEPPEFLVIAGPSEGGATTGAAVGRGRSRGTGGATRIKAPLEHDPDDVWSEPVDAEDDEAEGEGETEDIIFLEEARGGQASTSGNPFEAMGVDDRVAVRPRWPACSKPRGPSPGGRPCNLCESSYWDDAWSELSLHRRLCTASCTTLYALPKTVKVWWPNRAQFENNRINLCWYALQLYLPEAEVRLVEFVIPAISFSTCCLRRRDWQVWE